MMDGMGDLDWGLFAWGDWPTPWTARELPEDSDDHDDDSDDSGVGGFRPYGSVVAQGWRGEAWNGTVSVMWCRPIGLGGRTMACQGSNTHGCEVLRKELKSKGYNEGLVSVFALNSNIEPGEIWQMVHRSERCDFEG
eukprot:TRINITY_DN21326_c0_g1_i2.p2 TRINITY_DN21326_c0_g1~~TRINITY_DN21326_c0_g1_i2.p2  ORF type:complete len:137 (-),score=20.33 TRINITY_DN21326_c0_g1_i2:175-585(-)